MANGHGGAQVSSTITAGGVVAGIAAAVLAGAIIAGATGKVKAQGGPPAPQTGSETSDTGVAEGGNTMATATFGAGCFWGVEEAFRQVEGVTDTAVGYEGGHVEHPTYQQVCTDRTGHAEVVQVQYDPERVSYEELLGVFWRIHDPTQVNRQGPDRGYQYRSVIFYHTPEQQQLAQASKAALGASGELSRPVATAIEPAQTFWRAEEYHQQYLARRGGGAACHR